MMKKKISITLALLLMVIAVNAQVNFIKQPQWNEVLARAKAENKYIFMDAYTDWCSWCKVMDKNTFSSGEVGDLLNSKFIAVKMEMETGFGITLAMKYHVNSFPTFLIFDREGRLIDRMVGYQKATPFITNVEKIISGGESQFLKGYSPEIEMPYPDFYKKAYNKNEKGKKEKPDSTVVQTWFAAHNDLTQEINWTVLNRFKYMATQYDAYVLDKAAVLKELYGTNEVNDFIDNIIYQNFQKVLKGKDEALLNSSVYPMIDKYHAEDAQKTKTFYEITFYTQTGNFPKMIDVLNRILGESGFEDNSSMVNSSCWEVYEKCDDVGIIASAADLMGRIVEKEPEYAYLDTFAALLYKSKRLDEAEKYAALAIEVGNKSKENVKSTEELLEKIKSAKAK